MEVLRFKLRLVLGLTGRYSKDTDLGGKKYLGEIKTFSPQEISAMVLTKVRNRLPPTTVFKI